MPLARKLQLGVLLLAAISLAVPARADTLAADKETLLSCIRDAYPEGDLLAMGRSPRSPGDCIGLISRSSAQLCSASTQCIERETKAWLALAREVNLERVPARKKAIYQRFVAGIEKQARALCIAGASVSNWGKDSEEEYRVEPDNSCLREAVAGMVVPLLGMMQGP